MLHYRQGKQVLWSGFSSATPIKEVALNFARSKGQGGVLLRISLLPNGSRSRDIQAFSAIPGEDEACSPRPFPRFPFNPLFFFLISK